MKLLQTTVLFCALVLTNSSYAQSSDEKAIHQTIINFSAAGDQHQVHALENLLDANYRIVMNQLFGSKEVQIVPKSVYLEKIRAKEWGGDRRKVSMKQTTINGLTASVKVVLKGSKTTMTSLITLIKTEAGAWKIISDAPTIL